MGDIENIEVLEGRANSPYSLKRFLVHFLSGGTAGMVSRTCTAPLDRVKIIFQTRATIQEPNSVLHCMRYMIKEGGVKSMWRGNGANVLKQAPESAIKFFTWDVIKRVVYSDVDAAQVPFHERFVAGAISGVVSQASVFPIEMVKTRLATGKTGYHKGIIDCATKIYVEEGFRAFYRGLTPAMIGVVPYAGIELATYDLLMAHYLDRFPGCSKDNKYVALAFGAISCVSGAVVAYPLLLIRTRLQAKPTNKNTMLQEFREVIKHGPRALYRGVFANFLKVIPAVSISFFVMEQMKVILRQYQPAF